MKNSIKAWIVMTMLGILLFFHGCSMTTLQSPRTLEPGRSMFGLDIGIGTFHDLNSEIYGELAFCSRFGMCRDLDIGLKLGLPYIFLGDIKYQILHRPAISASLGFSYFPKTTIDMFGTSTQDFVNIYPALLGGSEFTWLGIKCPIHIVRVYTGSGLINHRYLFPGITIGHSSSGNNRFVSELNVYYCVMDEDNHGVLATMGIGFHFTR